MLRPLFPAASLLLLLGCSTRPGTPAGMPAATPRLDTAAAAGSTPQPPGATAPVPDPEPPVHGGTHPISLQWISWDKKGTAAIRPADSGWYRIHGSQLNADREYLNIDGRIRRVSAKELLLDGTVETRTRTNNGGEPCVKTGRLRFFARGNRTYYRLQDMENCMGGNVVDYVDIYPGTSTL